MVQTGDIVSRMRVGRRNRVRGHPQTGSVVAWDGSSGGTRHDRRMNKTQQSISQAGTTIADGATGSGLRKVVRPPTGAVAPIDDRHARRVAAVRIAFGLIWLVDAALKWTPHFINGYIEHLGEGSEGRPGWLDPWFRFLVDLQSPAPKVWAYSVAVIETLIALALLFGFARKIAYMGAALFSAMIWATAEGFGGPYTGGGADVDTGAGLIYAIAFISLLLLTCHGPDPYSLDAVIERRRPRWRRFAQLGPHS